MISCSYSKHETIKKKNASIRISMSLGKIRINEKTIIVIKINLQKTNHLLQMIVNHTHMVCYAYNNTATLGAKQKIKARKCLIN